MGYQPLEKLLPQSGSSIYRLVLMAAKRATELADGAARLIDFPSSEKTATVALEEICANKVMLKEIDEARKMAEPKSKSKKKE